MEIDSGFCSVKDTPFRLRTHTGGSRMWFCYVTMQYQGQSKELPVYVTKVRGHLFGREWLESLQLDWPLLQVETSATIPVFWVNMWRFRHGCWCLVWKISKHGPILHKFFIDLATHLAPLHWLWKKDVKWSWGAKQEASTLGVKEMLLQDEVLMHYDSDVPLVLATDSSSYCLGAVLSHCTLEGVECPIAHALWSLGW